MNAMELTLHTKGLVSKICVITGWQIPDSEEYYLILSDQLKKFLVDEYQDINIDELEYAVRVFGTQIKDWGKSLNLSLVREAIDMYLAHRSELSKVEEQKSSTAQIEAPKESGPVDWSSSYEALKSMDKDGQFSQLIFWGPIYDWCVKEGKFAHTDSQKWDAIKEVRTYMIQSMEADKLLFKLSPEEKQDLERIKCINWHKDKKALALLVAPSKKLLLIEHLNLLNCPEP